MKAKGAMPQVGQAATNNEPQSMTDNILYDLFMIENLAQKYEKPLGTFRFSHLFNKSRFFSLFIIWG